MFFHTPFAAKPDVVLNNLIAVKVTEPSPLQDSFSLIQKLCRGWFRPEVFPVMGVLPGEEGDPVALLDIRSWSRSPQFCSWFHFIVTLHGCPFNKRYSNSQHVCSIRTHPPSLLSMPR